MTAQTEVRDSFRLLIIASVVTLVLWFLPFAWIVTYPVRLFVTLIHEAGHALAALGTLGSVHQIELYADGAGLTETRGGLRFLISSAGYLSTTAVGTTLLLLLRRARIAKPLALATGLVLLGLTVFFGGNLLAWLAGLGFGLGLVLVAVKAGARATHFLMSFLAVQLVLNAFYDLRTLMYLTAFDPARPSDAQNMAAATGGVIPPILWALGWSAASVVMLSLTLMAYYRSLERRALPAPLPAGLIAGESKAARSGS